MGRFTGRRFASSAILISVAVGACAGSGGPSRNNEPPAPTSNTPSTLDADAVRRAEVLDAYRRSWEAFVAVASDPLAKPDDPRLATRTTGNSLFSSQTYLVRLKSRGQVFRGSVELHPMVVELTDDRAVVKDCNIDRTSVVDARTGEVLVPPSAEGSAATATLIVENGVWKQTEFTDEKKTCVPAPGS